MPDKSMVVNLRRWALSALLVSVALLALLIGTVGLGSNVTSPLYLFFAIIFYFLLKSFHKYGVYRSLPLVLLLALGYWGPFLLLLIAASYQAEYAHIDPTVAAYYYVFDSAPMLAPIVGGFVIALLVFNLRQSLGNKVRRRAELHSGQ